MKNYFLLAGFLLLLTAQAQVPGYVPSNGLIGWWGFDGNSNDASVNSNNLTNHSAVLVADRHGNSNNAYSFNGTSQYLDIQTPAFNFSPSGNFTVSFWMLKTSNNYGIAVMSSTGASGNFIWNFQTGSSGSFQFGTNKQGSAWSWAQTTYSLNQWDHFLATYNNGAMTLYVNGTQAATSTYNQVGGVQATLPFWVGRGHGGNYFTGSLDDLGVWNRVLTSTEIDMLYNGCNVSISNQPTHVAAAIGASASFTVATADTGVTYQWQQNTGAGFQNLANGGQFSGVNTDVLSVKNLVITNDGDQYRCFIEANATCTDTSTAATLNVCGAITSQPMSQTVPTGSATYFAAGSSDPSATYQWQLATTGAFGNLYNGTIFTGVTTDTLKITSTSAINNGQKFRCIVASGLCTDTTNEATLTVNGIGIDEEFITRLKMYPNPTHNFLTIETPNNREKVEFNVINQTGQVVISGFLTDEKTILDVQKLTTGLYIIRFGDGFAKTFSVVR